MHLELIYFRWSHYNEKARWALEYKGVPYARRTVLPGTHMEAARRLTGATMVPILVMDGRAINDSTRIIAALEERFPSRPLYPRDAALRARALELEDFFDEELGPHIRRVIVAACLPHTVYMAHLFDSDAPFAARWLYRAVLHARKGRFAERMQTDAATVARSWDKVEQAMDRLEREIRPSGYLVGNTFTVADLTAAAMLSIAVLPPEFPCLPRKPLPPEIRAVNERVQQHACWHWVRDIYQRHRAATAPVAALRSAPPAATAMTLPRTTP
jgi:glutathione S-transferase